MPIVKAVVCCWMVVPLVLGDERPNPRLRVPLRSDDRYVAFLERHIKELRAVLGEIEKERMFLEAWPRGDHTKEIESLRQREFYLSREIIRYKREVAGVERSRVRPFPYMPMSPPPKPKVRD